MKTVRNPLFFADVILPLLDEIREGKAAIRIHVTPRDDSTADSMEFELRATKIGATPWPPKRPRR